MATGRVHPTWIPPSSSDAGLFTFGIDVVADVNQDVAGVWWFQPPAPGTITNVTVGLYVQATQTLVPGASATILAGSITAGTWTLGTFGAPVTMTAGVTYTIVATCSGEHGFEDPVGYPINDPTNTVHWPSPGRFQAGAGPYPAASTWSGAHGMDIEMVEAEVNGTLDLMLPVPTVSLTADVDVSGSLGLTLPVPTVSLTGNAPGGPVTPALSMAQSWLDCLQDELLLKPDPPAQFCLRAGDTVLHDADAVTGTDTVCCPGLAYVRIGDLFPSSNFPEPDTQPGGKGCFPISWAVQLTAGVIRCIPGMGDPAGPDCVDWTSAAVHDADDLDALMRSLCCWGATLPRTRLWLVQGSTVQMQADCIERSMTLIVSVPRCC